MQYRILVLTAFLSISLIASGAIGPNRSPSDTYVFLSFSMPEASLKVWIAQAKEKRAAIVINGLIENSFKKTLSKISSLNANSGLYIDPTLFRKYGVKKVPAVAVDYGNGNYSVVYGNIGLNASLEELCETSEHKACTD